MLHTIKHKHYKGYCIQLNNCHIILKIKFKIFQKKSRCSRLVTVVAVGMVRGYCVPSYISDKLCIPSIALGNLVVLVYVVSVIIMQYTISYTEICYLVNRRWHRLCSAL